MVVPEESPLPMMSNHQHSQKSMTATMALMMASVVKIAVISHAVVLRRCHYLECAYIESVK